MNWVCFKVSFVWRKYHTLLLTVCFISMAIWRRFSETKLRVFPSTLRSDAYRCKARGVCVSSRGENDRNWSGYVVKWWKKIWEILWSLKVTEKLYFLQILKWSFKSSSTLFIASCDSKSRWSLLRTFHTIFLSFFFSSPDLKGFTLKKCFIATFSFYIAFPCRYGFKIFPSHIFT